MKPVFRQHQKTGNEWVIYTDGSCLNPNTKEARMGAGTYCPKNDDYTKAIRVPGDIQTNQRGELIAILKALQMTPKGDPLKIKTDSMYAAKGIIEGLNKWEDIAWYKVDNTDIFQKIKYEIDIRGGRTELKWIKGHNGTEGNEKADEMANEGANKETEDEINLETPEMYQLKGARLASLTQKTTYGLIMRSKNINPVTKTGKQNITEMRNELQETLGVYPSEKAIWLSLKKSDIRRNITDFLWKLLHGRLRAGTYWLKVPGYEDRANCKHCGATETMNHIWFECETSREYDLWGRAEKLWTESTIQDKWIIPNEALIRGLAGLKKTKTFSCATKMRKYAIIVLETAWLLWKARNEVVIAERQITKNEINRRWTQVMKDKIESHHFRITTKKNVQKKRTELTKFKKMWTEKEHIASINKGRLTINKKW